MKHYSLLILTAAFLSFATPAFSDVFSLWPFHGSSAPAQGKADLASALEPKRFWQESVSVNGRKMTLDIGLLDTDMVRAVSLLRSQFPAAGFAANGNSILVEQKLKNGMRRRIFILELNGIPNLLQFSMDIPDHMPTLEPGLWPADFPLPPGAVELQTMAFPKRNATYGSFSSPYSKDQVLADLTTSLKASGWNPLTSESNQPDGSGNIFMREKPMSMMILGILPARDGKTRVNLYMRPIH